MSRYLTLIACIAGALACLVGMFSGPHPWAWIAGALILGALTVVGLRDLVQRRHSVLRNYPIIGHMRWMIERIRPEIRQYLMESDQDGTPFTRAQRSLVYARAKGEGSERPFGTQLDVYRNGYEFIAHSSRPAPVADPATFRLTIGNKDCRQPYSASIFNISAMSFGSLSANAIRALNKGAHAGGFAHDTGEGSISPHHREFGGDLIWEIGSGYFGCRDEDGDFSAARFREQASGDQVKMIEIKLSQGAKPGHGGILPAAKVTPEIAETRGVPMGADCVSPASHPEFSTPLELVRFVARLRELSDGKPVGFKLCIGQPWEFMGIVKAMLATGVATQDKVRQQALDVPDKGERVARYHRNTLHAFAEMIAAAGIRRPEDLKAHHLVRRVSQTEIRLFSQLHVFLEPGELLREGSDRDFYTGAWKLATAESFDLATAA
jgi:glutamate synthase domain-containing protein 2